MDLLSNVLLSLKVESSAIVHFVLKAPWGLEMHGFKPTYCYFVVEGHCWLMPADGEPVRLGPGDSVLVPRGGHSIIASDPAAPITFVGDIWRDQQLPVFGSGAEIGAPLEVRLGDGGAGCRLMSLAFAFQDESRIALLSSIPGLILLRSAQSGMDQWINSTMQFLLDEQRDTQPGYVAMATKLAELLFQSLIRAYLTSAKEHPTGWLRGLFDNRIGKALDAIHKDPGNAWSVEALARTAGMSRSAFAQRFQTLVGQPPIDYLTDWRMRLAADLLGSGRYPVADVAAQLGYQSETAFRETFKRKHGAVPSVYRKATAAAGN